MISPEVGARWDWPRNGTALARAEWHARERRIEAARRALVAMNAGDRTADAAPAAAAARSLGSSNCHISPKDRYPTKLHAWAHSKPAKALNHERHVAFIDGFAARDKKLRVRLHYEGTLIRIDGLPGWNEYENQKEAKRGSVRGTE